MKNIEKKIVVFEKEYETKIKGLENQLTKMNNLIEEKTSTISSFENYFKDCEQRFEKQEKENDALKVKIETLQATTKEIKKKQDDVETKINKQKSVDFETKIKYIESTAKKLDKSNDIFIAKIDKLESKMKSDEN